MATPFRPDRPDENMMQWYLARKTRCITQIWCMADDLLRSGDDVILELAQIQRQDRMVFYDRINAAGRAFTVYVLTLRDVRRDRVETRNVQQGSTFSMDVPSAIFEMARDMWEPPKQAKSTAATCSLLCRP
jgi:predicted kinase